MTRELRFWQDIRRRDIWRIDEKTAKNVRVRIKAPKKGGRSQGLEGRFQLLFDFGDGKFVLSETGVTLENLIENYLANVRGWTNEDIETMEELDLWLTARGR